MTIRPQEFTASMIDACERALDMNVFYQDQFQAQVLQFMGGFGCEPVLIDTRTVPIGATGPDRRTMTSDIEALMKASPRGHYLLMHEPREDGRHTYRVFASDGSGHSTTVRDCYDTPPTGVHVLSRMIGYEIYLCRKHVEQLRKRTADIEAFRVHRFRPGLEYRDVRLPGEAKAFSTAAIEQVSPATGAVTLLLSRRGTRKRWKWTIGATTLVAMLGKQLEAAAAASPSANAEQVSLFA